MSRIYLGKKALFVELGVKTGMSVHVDNPMEVGADRIVNGVAAFHQYGGPCVVVDFGTAITFDVISAKCEFLGGVIAPGVGIASEALFSRTARLPRVEIKDPGPPRSTPPEQIFPLLSWRVGNQADNSRQLRKLRIFPGFRRASMVRSS
jgi:pantothenate kinase type III